jgi:glycosyltransferase involved in cell wall biosynthesis
MNNLLIITYYWPPSGGAGVQRWVKLSKYLVRLGVDIHVLTVDPRFTSYLAIDESLENEVDGNIPVHRTRSIEPINWYGRLVGREKVPTAGFSNVDTRSAGMKLISFIRSHFFIPDPRRGWNRFAIKEAKRIIDEYGIQKVITSTPPHSGQLIGWALKKKRNVEWIADLRDPWTDIYYYPVLQHSWLSGRLDRHYEEQTLLRADRILTVSDTLKDLFLSKSRDIEQEKITVLPNGYDPADFEGLSSSGDGFFKIVYTGTMSDQYNPDTFLLALADFVHNSEVKDIRFKITGKLSGRIQNKIRAMKLESFFIHQDTVPHGEVNQVQWDAQMLLLLIPDVTHARVIPTGKLYEYIATGNPILCLGPEDGDAARIIESCSAGATFERENFEGIKQYIIQQYLRFKEGSLNQTKHPQSQHYNRKNQAERLYKLLFNA